MKPLAAFVRAALWWLAPLVALCAVVAYETGFGHALRKTPPAPAAVEPKPVVTSLLPEYAISGGIEARRETVERALFTPTRRPAPALLVQAATPKMQRGQFALTGTLIVDGKHTAFLRETNGRSRYVTQGDRVNGILVADVQPDRVKLAMGDEVEELVLRVSTNPRPTPHAALPGVPAAAQAAPVAAAPPGVVPTPDVAQTLAERRRAARAAQAAAAPATPQVAMPPMAPAGAVAPAGMNGAAPAAPAQPVSAPAQSNPAASPTWNDVYQRYQYRTR